MKLECNWRTESLKVIGGAIGELMELTFQTTYVDSENILAHFPVYFRIAANGTTNLPRHKKNLFIRRRYIALCARTNNLETETRRFDSLRCRTN